MFFIYSMIVLFVLLPLSISASNRIGKGQPLNKVQTNLFVNRDVFQQALGKHYQLAWWLGWAALTVFALYAGYWLSVVVFAAYVWSRLRFQKIVARPAAAIDAAG
ncbi:hypothetical protein [Silanimonas sp.]|jgi:hypothetical protein|uniref:hypothetical protein n=1 Tax=Silanimonas sp. TaxID=1929290 RepID=UPI0037C89A4C